MFKDLEKEVSWTATEQQKEKVYIRDKQSSLIRLVYPVHTETQEKSFDRFRQENIWRYVQDLNRSYFIEKKKGK